MAAVIFNKAHLSRSLNQVPIIAIVSQKKYSDEAKVFNLSQLKRGTGGRSSFSGIVATVFGASGFVGRYVVNRLGKCGSQIIVPYRGEAFDVRYLKVAGDLGQVLFCPFFLKDEESLEKAMKYSNVVINLIGRDYETKNFKFDDVHVKGAANIAKIAKRLGVERLIHFSALNASDSPTPVVLNKPSGFYTSKYYGEEAVCREFPDATIIRPADIYGQEDRFLRYYASAWRRQFGAMPLWKKGEHTIKQPVYVGDVAAAVIAAIRNPDSAGKIYQAVGPKRYYLSDLVDWMYSLMRKSDDRRGYFRYDQRFDPSFAMKVTLTNLVSPSWPLFNLHWERVEREYVTDCVEHGVPTLEDLGVNLTSLENQGPWEIRPLMADLYYGHAADEPFPQPPPPKSVEV
ncbi:NADH dehydrogenase [ubiquinone] 1 alpha subcomplex subunit 9, mitochondrial [Onthophagus taurus]|uniref:NADH dehydrogenase [ubiquinone] 1 alpha subcomplex subunit 9, mitochondrial n=1 Tax=Onthophagus taurus TaxID=166361 RepID=UPI000C1FF35C|nr:NADH dehydrogenase [ubiquinone] 1 alpha subcomplex subunit 9, mitochondrial [Onthophagus taurus]